MSMLVVRVVFMLLLKLEVERRGACRNSVDRLG